MIASNSFGFLLIAFDDFLTLPRGIGSCLLADASDGGRLAATRRRQAECERGGWHARGGGQRRLTPRVGQVCLLLLDICSAPHACLSAQWPCIAIGSPPDGHRRIAPSRGCDLIAPLSCLSRRLSLGSAVAGAAAAAGNAAAAAAAAAGASAAAAATAPLFASRCNLVRQLKVIRRMLAPDTRTSSLLSGAHRIGRWKSSSPLFLS